MTTRRKPVPASGDPLPDAINAADATPPATDTTTNEGGESNADGEQATSDAPATDTAAADQASGNADQVSDQANAAPSTSTATDQPAGADQSVETDQPTPPATEPQKPAEPEIVDARVLLAFEEHEADDIISAPALVIEQLKLAGRVDPHPDAVAYARSLHA